MGQKRPNDFGLFDMHGNVWTWCQDRYHYDYPKAGADQAVEDQEDNNKTDAESRLLRGGAFADPASIVRSAYRSNDRPSNRVYVGLRPARTYR